MNKITTFNFVITGGHHNSALVVAQEFVKFGHKVNWFGHRSAAKGDLNDSAEYIEVTASDLPFYNLVAGKFTLSNGLRNLLNIPLGFLRALMLLRRLKANAVISFGGYLGVAVSIAAFLLRIPVYLHEQTVTAGLANKFVAKFARRIFLTWDSSRKYFPSKKSVLVGLPLRKSILNGTSIKLFCNKLPTILIMGGKQGSHVINNLIFKHLPELLSSYNLIHQTGTSSVTGDYDKSVALASALPKEISDRYVPRGYIGENEIGDILRSSELYLGRSGAHITYELALIGLPSVLVPLLTTHDFEQLKNANMLEKFGLGIILGESDLSYPKLMEMVKRGLSLKPKPQQLARDAAEQVVKNVVSDLEDN